MIKKDDTEIKAVIFDAFDTLVSDGVRLALEKITKEVGFSSKDELLSEMTSWKNNWENLWLGKLEQGEIERNIAGELGQETSKKFFSYWAPLTKKDSKMIALVQKIKKRALYKLGLLTNTPPQLVEKLNQEVQFELFDAVLISCNYGLMKPDPKIYQATTDKLNVHKKNCLFIDDSPKNVNAAKKFGMQAVQFKGYEDLEERLKKLNIVNN